MSEGVLGIVLSNKSIDSALDAARGVRGGGWKVQVQVQWLLICLGDNLSIFNCEGEVQEVNLS